LVADRDTVEQVGVASLPQDGAERLLADQQHLQRGPHVECRADQQPQVGQGVAVEEVGLVEDQQQRSFGACGPLQDLFVKAFLSPPGRFAELRDDQLEQSCTGQVGEVAVKGLALLWLQGVEEPLEQRRLAHAAGTGDQAELAALDQVVQACQPLVHPLVLPQGGDRGVFREGLALELEVFQIHYWLLG